MARFQISVFFHGFNLSIRFLLAWLVMVEVSLPMVDDRVGLCHQAFKRRRVTVLGTRVPLYTESHGALISPVVVRPGDHEGGTNESDNYSIPAVPTQWFWGGTAEAVRNSPENLDKLTPCDTLKMSRRFHHRKRCSSLAHFKT